MDDFTVKEAMQKVYFQTNDSLITILVMLFVVKAILCRRSSFNLMQFNVVIWHLQYEVIVCGSIAVDFLEKIM